MKKDNPKTPQKKNPSSLTLIASGDTKMKKFLKSLTLHSSIKRPWKMLLNPLINALIKLVKNCTSTINWNSSTWETAKRKVKKKKRLLLFSDNFSRLWPDQYSWVQEDFSLNHQIQMRKCVKNSALRTLTLRWMMLVLWKNFNWIKTDSFDPSVNLLRTMMKTLTSVQFVLKKENCNDFLFCVCWFFIKQKKTLFQKILLFLIF